MSFAPVREERFAVVLYGGVSLAIYMNGIAQELLRMVRGTDETIPDNALDRVEMIYRELAMAMPDGHTRCVIDIISGTSAGGINGVALAKALVSGCTNLDALRRAWVEEADIGLLLNDRRLLPGANPAALLDGDRMYKVLCDTLAELGRTPNAPLGRMVELYVTATDLDGRVAPIQLTGAKIDELIHKSVFRFRYDADDPESAGPRGDFGDEYDRMLAFAARCTSSFPIAFEPMRFKDIRPRTGEADLFARFFPGGLDPRRQYADGGYLDNRPFSHAIEAIPMMPRSMPGGRTLFFVDPFPDDLSARAGAAPGEYDFLQNAKLAATTLPRRETIRDDIRQITGINRRLDRLSTLQKRWENDRRRLGDPKPPEKPEELAGKDLAYFLAQDGYCPSYALYHHLRVYGATDTLATLVASLGGYEQRSDEWYYLRHVVRAWREAHFEPYAETTGLETETDFLSRYDIDFRIRRLTHLRDRLDAGELPPDAALRDETESQLGHFRRRARARTPEAVGLSDAAVAPLRARLEEGYARYAAQPCLNDRYEQARRVYLANEALIDPVMTAIGGNFGKAFAASSQTLRTVCGPEARAVYDGFHWHDVVTFPFLEGTSAEEHGEVRVFRISPADNNINASPNKLAGLAAGAFGGFLNRDWRQHDILWGRLDGAERIVAALLPEARQQQFRDKLHDAILLDEFGGKDSSERRLALVEARLKDRDVGDDLMKELKGDLGGAVGVSPVLPIDLSRFSDFYATTTPLAPPSDKIASWGSRSASILAQMIDGLPGDGFLGFAKGRAAGSLRTGGVLAAQLTRFAMPGSFARSIADHLLFLAIWAGILLALLRVLSGESPRDGLLITGIAALAWAGLYATGRVFRGKSPWSRPVVWALGIVLVVCAVFGAEALAIATLDRNLGVMERAADLARRLRENFATVALWALIAAALAFATALVVRNWRAAKRITATALWSAVLALALFGAYSLWRDTGLLRPTPMAEAAAGP